jgi:hypothetical protein
LEQSHGPISAGIAHGQLEQIFPDIFFVTRAMETVLMNTRRQFSRNMTVVRATR